MKNSARAVADKAVSRRMPPLMRQAAILENTLTLLIVEAKANGAQERLGRLWKARSRAIERFFRRKDKWL